MTQQIQMVRTPEGPLALGRKAAETLLREGVLSGTLDGDLHAADAATVKAALMAAALCDFCTAPGASHHYDVPDFGIAGVGQSVGGWLACDTCDGQIAANKRQALVDRSMAAMAFPKFTRTAVEELHAKFWEGMDERLAADTLVGGLQRFINDAPLPEYAHIVSLSDRDVRIAEVARVTGLTVAQVRAGLTPGSLSRDAMYKILQTLGGGAKTSQQWMELLTSLGPRKPLPDVVPHWQRALDGKFAALAHIRSLLQEDRPGEVTGRLMAMGFGEDLRYLAVGDAYSFNADTIAAIREAARGIPVASPLSSIETPNTGAGWFWFAEPLPVTASPSVSDRVQALLWGWSNGTRGLIELVPTPEVLVALGPVGAARLTDIARQWNDASPDTADVEEVEQLLSAAGVGDAYGAIVRTSKVAEPALCFTTYVLNEKRKVVTTASGGRRVPPDTPLSSVRWSWPLSMSLQEMLQHIEYTWEVDPRHPNPPTILDQTATVDKTTALDCVRQLSLFFVMACLWFKQTVPVLTREPGPVERHARKRYVREHKLDAVPTVQVVALRKTLRVPAEQAEGSQREGARQYHCRWIVKGHPRLQACGPGRKDKKLIWIEAHPAGPEDKPLRTREKVYAVIR